MALYTEDRRLKFDDSQAINAEVFDNNRIHQAPEWKKVDFTVEWENELWLLEVKDPTEEYTTRYHPKSGKEITEPYICQHLFTSDLGPKGRDSFLYLYLLDVLSKFKKVIYIILIANDFNKPASLDLARKELKRIMAMNKVWFKQNKHAFSIATFNLENWNKFFYDKFPVERLS